MLFELKLPLATLQFSQINWSRGKLLLIWNVTYVSKLSEWDHLLLRIFNPIILYFLQRKAYTCVILFVSEFYVYNGLVDLNS